MSITQLNIQSLRNIEAMTLLANPRLNVIVGENASGKTSLLEAIYLLGRGKSFRSALSRSVVTKGQESLIVFGHLNTQAGQAHRLGVQIQAGQFKAKLDGVELKKSSDLAGYLPLLFISPDADKLINSSPRQRRRFLDWGLFHVEPSFLQVWQRYNRILTQRNKLLKLDTVDQLDVWDTQLIEAGEQLHRMRLSYVDQLASVAQHILSQLSELSEVKLSYKSGWPKELSLETGLMETRSSDRNMGFTQRGPHRCDLVLKVQGQSAANFLSGGQQKILASALLLAQAKIFNEHLADPCLLLVDDLPAELDEGHRQRFMEVLYNTGSQLFVTATSADLLNIEPFQDKTVFHVEHGVLAAK